LNRFWFGFGFFYKKKEIRCGFFFNKNRTEPKMIPTSLQHIANNWFVIVRINLRIVYQHLILNKERL
jgi:hypothetical protein